MGKRQAGTPRSKIRAAIRQVWLRSREHAEALKRAGYTCCRCGVKQSKAKGKEVSVEVHHKVAIAKMMDEIITMIIREILQTPEDYEVLCRECHKQEHDKGLNNAESM